MDNEKIDKAYELMDAILMKEMEAGGLTFEEVDCIFNRLKAKIWQAKVEAYLAFRNEESANNNSMYT